MTIMQMSRHQIGKTMGFFTDGRWQDADTVSNIHQTIAGIVLTENQAAFGTRSEHAVRFIGSLCDEIVYHYTDVGILTTQNKWFFAAYLKDGIYACHNPLSGGFFVSGRSIDLPSKEKTGDTFRFKRMLQFAGINTIILDRIGVFQELRMFQTGY